MLSVSPVRAVVPRRIITIGAMGVVWLAVSGPLSPTAAATHAVDIGDGFFGPGALTVTVGDTVTWTNRDDSPHTVTADGAFDSGNVEPGRSFSHTFSEPGTYTYVCQYHDEMVATITVVEAAKAPAEPTAPAALASVAPGPAGGSGETSGAADGTTTHTGGEHGAGQPDTALPSTIATGVPSWLAPLLIGLGLVAFAVAVVPPLPAFRRGVTREARAPSEGWRR
jgi:plastocyanin